MKANSLVSPAFFSSLSLSLSLSPSLPYSVVEYPATMLAFFLGKFTTRRFSLLFLHALCGLAMVASALLRWTEALEASSAGTKAAVFNTLNISAKFFVTACFSVMCYVPAEVFPTNVR